MNKDYPIPLRMAHLPKDKRGFPIPVSILLDNEGTPHFTITDTHKATSCAIADTCHLCGKSLTRAKWLIGGPRCAFHTNGAYLDGPMHLECAQYALNVCPYIALKSYTKEIGDKKLDYSKVDEGFYTHETATVHDDKPNLFVLVGTTKLDWGMMDVRPMFVPTRPFFGVHFWKDGKQLNNAEQVKELLTSDDLFSEFTELQYPDYLE